MKFWLRWIANGSALFLALYLVDSIAGGRLRVEAVWIAVVLAVVLGLINSLIRPLHRVKSKPRAAAVRAVATVVVNWIVLQSLIWGGVSLSSTSLVWTLALAAFLSLLAGIINWLIGFKSKEKARPATRERAEARPSRARQGRTPGS
jgi:putative membrane protein